MKAFGMKHKIFLSILPFFIVFAIVGSGFALFIFQEEETTTSNAINISITDGFELGNIYLTKDTVTSSTLSSDYVPSNLESDDSNLSTKLFFDYDNIYFIRSDNITKERTFNIYYYNNTSESIDLSKISLNLDITIENKNDNTTYGIQEDSTNGYFYSDRAIDYIDLGNSKSKVTIDDKTYTSKGSKVIDNDTKKSYNYKILTGLTNNTNYDIDLDLKYTSNLAPSYSSNSSYFKEVIAKMKEAMTSENTSINLNFYLTYED